jgi:hypothetical protein
VEGENINGTLRICFVLFFNEFQGRNTIFRLMKGSQNNNSILNYAFLFTKSRSLLDILILNHSQRNMTE